MKEQLLTLLKSVRRNVDFENDRYLIDDGILDSLDIITIIRKLNDAFDIEINVDDLEPDNFNTVDAMIELIEKLQAEG